MLNLTLSLESKLVTPCVKVKKVSWLGWLHQTLLKKTLSSTLTHLEIKRMNFSIFLTSIVMFFLRSCHTRFPQKEQSTTTSTLFRGLLHHPELSTDSPSHWWMSCRNRWHLFLVEDSLSPANRPSELRYFLLKKLIGVCAWCMTGESSTG